MFPLDETLDEPVKICTEENPNMKIYCDQLKYIIKNTFGQISNYTTSHDYNNYKCKINETIIIVYK